MAASTTAPLPAATGAIYPGGRGFVYYGCYNETTLINGTGGRRALAGGVMEAQDIMTASVCIDYCNMGGYKFAGLEYQDECWCAQYLSAFSNKLDDSACDLYCKGNSSQICGGNLVLTTYTKLPTSASPRTITTSAKLLAALLGISGIAFAYFSFLESLLD